MKSNEEIKEQKRVDLVVDKLTDQVERTQAEFNRSHAETKRVQENYSTNTSVNYFEVDDRIETSAELQQQRGLVTRLTENETILKRQLSTYKQLKKSPYFGRIDILDDDSSEVESLYIGTASFVDENGEFLIYDWRAPISSIYYNGTLGQVSYETPAGKQTTDLQKKRQFQINDGQIINMFDTNETVGDEMLQTVLGQQNDEQMQNIVATIQREQNDIIRDTTSDLLVVQGVAGSGKTSAILQRIAFLLYHSRDTLEADQIILFSPNKLFSHYIADVLPSLGERNMRQVTLAEFFDNRLKGLKVQTLFERYEADSNLTKQELNIRTIKESATYMDDITNYCDHLDSEHMAFDHLMFNGEIFFNKQEIKDIFASWPKALKLSDKMLKTKNELIKRLKHRIHQEITADWVNDAIDELSDERYHDLMGSKRLGDFQDETTERNYIAVQIVSQRLNQVYDGIFNNNFFDPYVQYSQYLHQCPLFTQLGADQVKQLVTDFNQRLELHQINLTDVAPLLYLRDYTCGGAQNQTMKYLFVDEMQDYSLAQLKYLRYAFPKTKWTLLGDSEQALFKEVETPAELLNKFKNAFQAKRARLISLMRSYRSTYPITTFAKSILPNGKDIEAFNRTGDLPEIILTSDEPEAIQAVIASVKTALTTSGTVAILTKNMPEAQALQRAISHQLHSTLLQDADRTLPTGCVILPIYLAKGLEFDAVVAWNVSAQNYPDDKLLGTLYTIISRAMHSLTLISVGKLTPLIANNHLALDQLKIARSLNLK